MISDKPEKRPTADQVLKHKCLENIVNVDKKKVFKEHFEKISTKKEPFHNDKDNNVANWKLFTPGKKFDPKKYGVTTVFKNHAERIIMLN